jgi:transcriptional regulator with XRE-family HTH domain
MAREVHLMAAMKTATRQRTIADLRALDATEPEEGHERALELAAMSTSAEILGLFEEQRELEGLTKADIARTLDAKREAVSHLLQSDGANPTVRTLTRLIYALGLHAEITFRKARETDERLIDVFDELEESELTAKRASGID